MQCNSASLVNNNGISNGSSTNREHKQGGSVSSTVKNNKNGTELGAVNSRIAFLNKAIFSTTLPAGMPQATTISGIAAVKQLEAKEITKELNVWHLRVFGVLAATIDEVKKVANIKDANNAFARFKFMLGPELYSLQREYDPENKQAKEWANEHCRLQYELYNELFQHIEVFDAFIKEDMLLSKRQDLISKLDPEAVERLGSTQKTHAAIIDQGKVMGLKQGYLNLPPEYLPALDFFKGHKDLKIDLILCEAKDIQLTGRSGELLRCVLEAELTRFIRKDALQGSSTIEDAAQRLYYAEKIQKKILDELFKLANLQVLEHVIEQRYEMYKKQWEAIKPALMKESEQKVELTPRENEFKQKQDQIIQAYRVEAARLLGSDEKLNEAMKFALWPDLKAEHYGLTHEGLIDLIISYNKSGGLACFASEKQIYDLYENKETGCVQIIENLDIRMRFQKELEKHLPSPRFAQALKRVTGMRDKDALYHASMQAHVLKQSSNPKVKVEQMESKAVCDRQMDNPNAGLESVIPEPLEWEQLRFILNAIPSRSEAQTELKKLLDTYTWWRVILQSDWLQQKFSKSLRMMWMKPEGMVTRRRQIEYLLSCLHMASTSKMDEGEIFSTLKESTQGQVVVSDSHSVLAGVDFILKMFDKNPSERSYLKTMLHQFKDFMKAGPVFLLRDKDRLAVQIDALEAEKEKDLAAAKKAQSIEGGAASNVAQVKGKEVFAPKKSALVGCGLMGSSVDPASSTSLAALKKILNRR